MPKFSKAAVASVPDAAEETSRETAELPTVWFRATFVPFQANQAWGEEAFRFARRRLEHNHDAVQRLTKCSSWQDLLELQMDWSREILEDYLAESREMLALVTRSANGRAAEETSGTGRHTRIEAEPAAEAHHPAN
jgi:hypothetical protein